MFAVIVAIAIIIFVLPLAYFLMVERAFMREHHRRYHDFLSEDQRSELLGANPVGLLRELPRDNLRRLNALSTPQEDPRLETLRRRAALAYLVFMVNVFACVPLALLLVALAQRISDGRLTIADWIPVILVLLLAGFWARYLIRARHARSRAASALGLSGVGVALILAAAYVSLGFVRL